MEEDSETMRLLVEAICSISLQLLKSIQPSLVVLIVLSITSKQSLRLLNRVHQEPLLAIQGALVIILKMIKFQLLFIIIIIEYVRVIVI